MIYCNILIHHFPHLYCSMVEHFLPRWIEGLSFPEEALLGQVDHFLGRHQLSTRSFVAQRGILGLPLSLQCHNMYQYLWAIHTSGRRVEDSRLKDPGFESRYWAKFQSCRETDMWEMDMWETDMWERTCVIVTATTMIQKAQFV